MPPILLDECALPRIYDDETLFSWCARYHRLTCNIDPRATSRQLFGHPHAGLRHDLPGNLDCFLRITQGKLGTSEQLLYQRTHFGLFAPFLAPQKLEDLIQGLCAGKHSVVHRALGLTRLGNDFTPQLKVCDACFAEDSLSCPSGWWHQNHQWLPVMTCLEHRRPLQSLALERTRYGLEEWVLPDRSSIAARRSPSRSDDQLRILTKIARWTLFLIQRPNLNLQSNLLRHIYMLKSLQHGWIAFDGTLRFADLCGAFLEEYTALIDLPGLGFLKDARKINGGFLGFLLRQLEGQRHPIKHIYLMAFLFDNEDEFLEMYQSASALAAQEGQASLQRKLTTRRDQLMALVANEGKSVTAASNQIGVSPTMAIRFLEKSGTSFERRARVLTPELRQRLDEMLRCGERRDEIAKTLSIRTGYIKNYLTQNKELKAAWSTANQQKVLNQYRKRFLQVLCDNPGVPIKRIRRMPMNGFQWLFRNDREWLEKHLPAIWHRTP